MEGYQKGLLTASLMAMALTGTSCSFQREQGEEPATAAIAGTESAAGAPRMAISWTMHQNDPVPSDAEMLRVVEDRFNIDLDVWNLENNRYETLLDLKLAQGEIPDLFRIRQPHDLLKYVNQGVLADIPREDLERYAPHMMRLLQENAPGYLEYGQVEGRYYGIPAVSATNKYRVPIVYRKDWLDRLGLEVPRTLEELERVMYAFAEGDPDGNGIKDTYGLSMEGMNVVFGAFGQIVFADQLYFSDKNGRLVIGALEPEMKQALTYLHKWYRDGLIDPEFITGENKGGYKHLSHAFIEGRIGMTSMGNYYHWVQEGDYMAVDAEGREVPAAAAYNARELAQRDGEAELVFGPPVTGPEGLSGSKGYNLLMSFTAIGADAAEEPGKLAAILQVLDYVSASPDPDIYASMLHGIRGKHWQWGDRASGDIALLPPYDTMPNVENAIGSRIGMAVPVEPKGRREQWASGLGLDQGGIYNAMEYATPALVRYGPDLIKMRNKAYVSIITGDEPVTYFDQFVENFMAAGGQEVLREANGEDAEGTYREEEKYNP